MRIIKPFLSISLALISILAFSQNKIELKYSFPEGAEYKTEMKIEQTIAMEANGQPMEMDQLMVFTINAKVLEASKDSMKIKLSVDRVIMNQKVMGMDINYDSDSVNASDPMTAQMHKSINTYLGKEVIQVINAKGKVLRTDLGELKGNAEFARNMGSMGQYIIYPNEAIKIGESFEQEDQQLANTGLKTVSKYTLKNIEKGVAVFDVESSITSIEGNKQGMQMEGEMLGTSTVNIETGQLITSEIEQEIEMVIQQAGMTIPAKVKGIVVLKSE